MPLPILKSAAKNLDVANSKIGSQVLCRCWEIGSKNCVAAEKSAVKTVLLPIHKSAALVESF